MIFLFHRLVAVHLKRQYVTPFQPTSAGRAAAARAARQRPITEQPIPCPERPGRIGRWRGIVWAKAALGQH